MAEFPALPLWTDAYMADCGHLSDAENGLYLKLLMILWRAPQQRVPNDKAWLAKRFGKTIEDIESFLMPVICEFCITDGNWITQKRLSAEWNYVKRRSVAQSERSKRRWQKEKLLSHGNAEPHLTGNARARNAPTPTPTPTPPLESLEGGLAKIREPSRKIRFPSDWKPDEQDIAFAVSLGHDMGWITDQAERCRDHHHTNGNSFIDFHGVWRNWVKRAAEFSRPNGKGNGHANGPATQLGRAFAEVLAEQEAGVGTNLQAPHPLLDRG